MEFDKTSKYVEYIPTLFPLHNYDFVMEITFLNITIMAYKLYNGIMISSSLNWVANKIKMYSNKDLKILLSKFSPPVYLRISLYTKHCYRSGYLLHDWPAFCHDSTGHGQWTGGFGGIPGRLSADLRRRHLHITGLHFFFWMSWW